MDKLTEMLMAVAGMVITVALLSVFLSRNSNTQGVLQAFFSGLGNSLAVATAPITGTTVTPNLSYPSATGGMSGFGGLSIPSLG